MHVTLFHHVFLNCILNTVKFKYSQNCLHDYPGNGKLFSSKLAEITPCASEKFGDCKVQHVTLQIVVNTFQALLIYFATLPQEKTLRVTLFCTGGFPYSMVNTPNDSSWLREHLQHVLVISAQFNEKLHS